MMVERRAAGGWLGVQQVVSDAGFTPTCVGKHHRRYLLRRMAAVTGPPPIPLDFKTRVTGGSRSPHCYRTPVSVLRMLLKL